MGRGTEFDGRSDIFSLGVVFYELLTGRRPFQGASHAEVLEKVATAEPRPPRQIDDTIPKELERITLKALSKRATERYTTARDMASDLRHFLQTEAATGSQTTSSVSGSPSPGSTQEATSTPTPGPLDPDGPVVKIVPKGLRSFDRHDADFFLELLPGPRDRDGLPESVRFWKTRIDTTDSDDGFRVGLIYGPSGCGKSSLVKAGLLPWLAKHVLAVYVEATPDDTETRLLKAVRKACPELSAGLSLVGSLAALRRGLVLRSGEKLLLVLDQFEQWLFARRGEENTELVAALRQCDGQHVQAIVLVRDDFWMAVTRFMRAIDIDLEPDRNIASVDLFGPAHARTVLAAFGRAYRALPERQAEFSKDQTAFLAQAIDGLAQDGKIISVRLALFAEMFKEMPWSLSTLREVGGTEGVGVAFLEETFASRRANPQHRLHQKAAQAVLKALLPRTGTDIKGQVRSERELLDASGYEHRRRDFDELIRILDHDLRLITPTEQRLKQEGGRTNGENATTAADRFDSGVSLQPPASRCFQLTHDYLVHSVRDWLTRKQRETRRGRAELRLAERASLWEAKAENRHLPAVMEYVSIRVLTRPSDWTDSQRLMMDKARRFYASRGLILALLIVLAGWGVVAGYGNLRASALVRLAQVRPNGGRAVDHQGTIQISPLGQPQAPAVDARVGRSGPRTPPRGACASGC